MPLPTTKHFANHCDVVVQLVNVYQDDYPKSATYLRWLGWCPLCSQLILASRVVRTSPVAKPHEECTRRCRGASAEASKCSCSCGGANHGIDAWIAQQGQGMAQ